MLKVMTILWVNSVKIPWNCISNSQQLVTAVVNGHNTACEGSYRGVIVIFFKGIFLRQLVLSMSQRWSTYKSCSSEEQCQQPLATHHIYVLVSQCKASVFSCLSPGHEYTWLPCQPQRNSTKLSPLCPGAVVDTLQCCEVCCVQRVSPSKHPCIVCISRAFRLQ